MSTPNDKIRVRKTPNCAHLYTATVKGKGAYGFGNTPQEARDSLARQTAQPSPAAVEQATQPQPPQETCPHNAMVEIDKPDHAWKCADCGYEYRSEDTTVIMSATIQLRQLKQYCDALQAQCDELLTVVKKQVNHTEQLARMVNHFAAKLNLGKKVNVDDFTEQARAAIARATEGGQS